MEVERVPRVAIIGAGVVGLSVAVRLSESSLPLHLTVIADKFSPDTTSDRAGAIFVHGGNYIPGMSCVCACVYV